MRWWSRHDSQPRRRPEPGRGAETEDELLLLLGGALLLDETFTQAVTTRDPSPETDDMQDDAMQDEDDIFDLLA